MLRDAKPEDMDFIAEGFADIHPAEETNIFRERIQKDVFGTKAIAKVYVYELEGVRIGFFLTSPCYFASTGPIMWVSQGYVAPAHCGKHFPDIFKLLQGKAEDAGYKRIVWATESDKKSLNRFWQRRGFRELNDFTFWLAKVNA